MSQETHKIVKQLIHSIIATACGCMLWYTTAQKITVTQTKEIPVCLYNVDETNNNLYCQPTTLITISFSPLTLLSTPLTNISVYIDAKTIHQPTTIVKNYHETIDLPPDIKIVHCNPITIHKVTKNTLS
ncbi:hypothetical protein EKK58_06795 [Candidatus Dependentiae bacterium]|nr:MAG: hypothetical protein EKK58_06795 [Candidatus Dependentiae bacterium]